MMNMSFDSGFLRLPPSSANTSMSGGWGKKVKRKKPQRNPFYFFMVEKRAEWLSEGSWQAHWGQEELVRSCLPLWKERKEDPQFMEPYIEQHRQWKEAQKGDLENKYDAMGRCLADLAREAERQRKQEAVMREEVREAVGQPGEAQGINTQWHVAHFNYLARTDDDFYIPCEVAVVKFSVAEGVTQAWTELISPLDSIPLGYKYRCVRHSRVTHNLTDDFEDYETDYKTVVRSLKEFLGGPGHLPSSSLPPLYVMPGVETEAAQCILRFMLDHASLPTEEMRVYPLPQLLLTLCPLIPSFSLATSLLTSDPFSHQPSLSCWLHSSLNNHHHCSLSIAARRAFSFLHAAKETFPGVRWLEGNHFPSSKTAVSDPRSSERLALKYSLVKEERINRFIPVPGGVTRLPQFSDERDFHELTTPHIETLHEDDDIQVIKVVNRKEATFDMTDVSDAGGYWGVSYSSTRDDMSVHSYDVLGERDNFEEDLMKATNQLKNTYLKEKRCKSYISPDLVEDIRFKGYRTKR